MKVTPPSPEPYPTPSETGISSAERGEYLGLKGVLRAFESTPLVPLIKEALLEAGIEPAQYEAQKYGHHNYYGLPATEANPASTPQVQPSPIVEAMYERMRNGTIRSRLLEPNTVSFTRDEEVLDGNPYLLNQLAPILVEALEDTATGKTLAYAVPVSSHGGRPGYAILSTAHIELRG